MLGAIPRSTRQPTLLAACFCSLALLASVAPAAEPPLSWEFDVRAAITKAGCNLGACHGNLNGKGGFRLSLRAEDRAWDHRALTHDWAGRRVNPQASEESLILLKATGQVAHQGGVRFDRQSPLYQTLRDWIAAGARAESPNQPKLTGLEVSPTEQVLIAPDDQVQLQATAIFEDGSRRDVSGLAVYETSNLLAEVSPTGLARRVGWGETTVVVRLLDQQAAVRLAFIPERADFAWRQLPVHNFIDRLVDAKLQTLRIHPSPLADDTMFLRRAYLDAIGIPPTAAEAQAFLADARPDKRERLIDALLARPEFAEHWAIKWADMLRVEEKSLDSKGVEAFHGWIRDSLAEDKPLDQFAREIVAARGSTYANPPANFYRANRDAATRGEAVARLFLGVRLQCAQCHNHPYDRWSQDDYFSWAAVFARIDYEILENNRRDKLDKHEFVGEQIVLVKDEGELKNARTGKNAAPQFLGHDSPLAGDVDRLNALADWLAAPDNRPFAMTQANFIWSHLMGRGLVEPIDDFRATNPPSHPELMEALTDAFVASGMRLRPLVRLIMASRTYQLSSEPNETNADDEVNYARASLRRLSAEQLVDAQSLALDAPAHFSGYPRGTRAAQIAGVRAPRRRGDPLTENDRLLVMFGKPERLLACQCERSDDTTLTQAFVLIGGQGLHERLTAPGNRVARLAASAASDAEVIEALYWSALSRPPTGDEQAAAIAYLEEGDRLAGLQDLAWALLNAKEFIFRR